MADNSPATPNRIGQINAANADDALFLKKTRLQYEYQCQAVNYEFLPPYLHNYFQ